MKKIIIGWLAFLSLGISLVFANPPGTFQPLLLNNGVTILFCNNAVSSTNTSSYTFSSISLSSCPITGNRQIVVVTDAVNNTAGSGFDVSSITVAGNSTAKDIAKKIVASTSANTTVEIWRILDNVSTSPNIIVTWTGAQLRSGIGVWAIYGANTGAASATASGDNASCGCSTAVTASLAIPNNGVAIIGTEGVSSPTAFTFTSSSAINPTKDYDQAMASTSWRAGAHTSTGGTQTFTVTPNASTFQSAIALAAYGS